MEPAVSFDIRRYARAAVTHSHPHHQIVLPIRGRLEMEVGARLDQVSARKAALVPAGEAHSFAALPGNAFLVVDVARGGLPHDPPWDSLWDEAQARPFVGLDGHLRGLCAFLAGEADAGRLNGLQAQLAGALLLGALGRGLGLEAAPIEPALREARAFMERHLQRPITAEAVARAAGLSVSRLHARFRARFGVGPMRYLTACRLARAARLLEQSHLPLAEIALAVGYGDQSAFTRAFRREFGTAPARYRLSRQERETRHKVQ
ncbi:MAG: helix-turn-helix domain-containing protein [Kiloniellales bacterium]